MTGRHRAVPALASHGDRRPESRHDARSVAGPTRYPGRIVVVAPAGFPYSSALRSPPAHHRRTLRHASIIAFGMRTFLRRARTALRLLLTDRVALRARLRARLRSWLGIEALQPAGPSGPADDRSLRHDEAIRYLYYEVSEIRSVLRHLAADRIRELPLRAQTYASFDYQWRNLDAGAALLSNPEFREQVTSQVCHHLGLDPAWFPGRRVLDAGCGSGRFSYAFARLGAQVTSVDQSEGGLAQVREACAEFADHVTTRHHDLLEPLELEPFDLVWSYGVLHHTGNTYRAFRNIAPLVAPGGYLFLMIYGEPRLDRPNECHQQAEYKRLRRLTRNKPWEEKIEIIRREKPGEDVHGWFDAISPLVNDLYAFEEIEGWLVDAGFEDVRLTNDLVNHHILARRSGETPRASGAD